MATNTMPVRRVTALPAEPSANELLMVQTAPRQFALHATDNATPPNIYSLVAGESLVAVNVATLDNPENLYDPNGDTNGYRLNGGALTVSALQTVTAVMLVSPGDIIFCNRRVTRFSFYSNTAGTAHVSTTPGRPKGEVPSGVASFRIEVVTAEKTGMVITLNGERVPDETIRPELLAGATRTGANLIDPTRLTLGRGLHPSQDDYTVAGAQRTTHAIAVTPGETLTVYRAATIHWLGADHQWIVPGNAGSSVTVVSSFPADVTVPAATSYFRASYADTVADFQVLTLDGDGIQPGRTANQYQFDRDTWSVQDMSRFTGVPVVWSGDSQSVANAANNHKGPPEWFGEIAKTSALHNQSAGGSSFAYRAAAGESLALCRAVTTWPDIEEGFVIVFAGGADALVLNGVEEGLDTDYGNGIDTTFKGGFETFLNEALDKYLPLNTELIVIWTLPSSDPEDSIDEFGDIAETLCAEYKVEFYRPGNNFPWPAPASGSTDIWLDNRHIQPGRAEWLAKRLYHMIKAPRAT